jgi:hypothetical protein
MLSSLIKSGYVESPAKLSIGGQEPSIKEVEIDFLIKMDQNVIGYGYNYIKAGADEDSSRWYGMPEWFKLSKDIGAKISTLSYKYPDAFCFLVHKSRIMYFPYSINIDLLKINYIKDKEDFVSKIKSKNTKISEKIEYQRKMSEEEEI